MWITDDLDCNIVMSELSTRFRQHRVSAHITQKELAKKTGVGLKTIYRFEKGEEIGLLSFIKLIQGVGLEHNLECIIPDYTKRPSYIAKGGNLPKRARKKKTKFTEWKWGDEQ